MNYTHIHLSFRNARNKIGVELDDTTCSYERIISGLKGKNYVSNVPVRYVASKVRFYTRKLSYIRWSMNSMKKGESFRHVLRTVVTQSST